MSDICDDADGVRRLSEGGARFGRRARGAAEKKSCSVCNGMPVWRSAGIGAKEIMICLGCGRQTEPLASRQALQTMWDAIN